jgi:hypothetical protein
MVHLIKEIQGATPYVLTLRFNTGETIIKVDLEAKLNEWSQSPASKFRQLLDPRYFATVKLDPESEAVYWDNGIDLCPDVLYMLGKEQMNGLLERLATSAATG